MPGHILFLFWVKPYVDVLYVAFNETCRALTTWLPLHICETLAVGDDIRFDTRIFDSALHILYYMCLVLNVYFVDTMNLYILVKM